MTTPIDIVVCVYNGLHHVRQCLRSVRVFTEAPYHLTVVDDGSDPYVGEEVKRILSRGWQHAHHTYLRNDTNEGYLRAVNRGVQNGTGDYVVLLNSDTLVTPGWLDGLRACLDAQPTMSIACPLSNHANFSRVAFPPGATFLQLAELVRRHSARRYPEIGLASGFCFIARRSLYDAVGVFDEIYGRGYYEESDLCMRAVEQGGRIVADDATFVYHHGWGSFGSEGRNQWMEENRLIFERRWGRVHDRWHEHFTSTRPFEELEGAIARDVAGQTGSTGPLQRSLLGLATRWGWTPPLASKNRGTRRDRATFETRSERDWTRLRHRRGRRLSGEGRVPRVLYLLPGLGPYGGVLSVAQLVNRLLLRGIHAQAATYGRVQDTFFQEQLFFRPAVFSTRSEMLRRLPRYDLVIATRWDTAYDALLLQERWACEIAMFVQDLEYVQEDDPRRVAAARRALDLIDHKIVKSQWLKDELEPFGGTVHRIPLGLNRDIFYPAPDIARGQPARIVSAARPGVSHRNLEGTIEIFHRLLARRDDVLPTFFGRSFEAPGLPADHRGLVTQVEVARLLRETRVLLDASLFQGFGRPGLEAMACGVPTVLTSKGGINEYARHEENCLQIDPADVDAAVAAVEQLLDDPVLAQRVRRNGLATARAFDVELEADRTADLILALLAGAAAPVDEAGATTTEKSAP